MCNYATLKGITLFPPEYTIILHQIKPLHEDIQGFGAQIVQLKANKSMVNDAALNNCCPFKEKYSGYPLL